MISNAVGSELIALIVGWKLDSGNFQESSPNLPQRLVIFSEANTANQGTLSTEKVRITSALQAGNLYGFGSPIHMAMRILFPKSGTGIGGIPVMVIAQAEAAGSTSKIIEITPSGVATKNGKHTLIIGGRRSIDGLVYNINIQVGDTTADIVGKISDAVNNILSSPMIGTEDDYTAQLESKWKGKTANDLTVVIDDNGDDLGITYGITSTQTASGTPSIAAGLDKIGDEWTPLILNGYGTDPDVMDALEGWNGIPDPNNPTGRYDGIIMKPAIAITGSTDENPSAITDTRLNNVTIALAPAPLSPGLHFEAAANMIRLFARISQDTPNLDVALRSYPDMPVPLDGDIGFMKDYVNRDLCVKKGCSTAKLNAGVYEVQDFVTTYHKLGEEPPQFRYPRNLMIDFNVRYSYYLLELQNVSGHSIADDNDTIIAEKVIKPKQWNAILNKKLFPDLTRRGLITQPAFSKGSLKVGLSDTNPDRLDTFFRYKRSGFARILSTTGQAGFNTGTN